MFQLTVNGLSGQVAVQHVEQARNLELFKSKHNMGAKYAMDYPRGTATPSPVQVHLRYLLVKKKGKEIKIMWTRAGIKICFGFCKTWRPEL